MIFTAFEKKRVCCSLVKKGREHTKVGPVAFYFLGSEQMKERPRFGQGLGDLIPFSSH
jgi:hypothetical protein